MDEDEWYRWQAGAPPGRAIADLIETLPEKVPYDGWGLDGSNQTVHDSTTAVQLRGSTPRGQARSQRTVVGQANQSIFPSSRRTRCAVGMTRDASPIQSSLPRARFRCATPSKAKRARARTGRLRVNQSRRRTGACSGLQEYRNQRPRPARVRPICSHGWWVWGQSAPALVCHRCDLLASVPFVLI